MYKKVLSFLLIFIMTGSLTLYGKSKTSRDVPGTAIFVMAERPTIPVETLVFKRESPELSLRLEVPQIKGLNNKKFEKQLNKELLKDALQAKKVAIETATAYNKDLIQDGLPPIKFERVRSYSIREAPFPYLVLGLFEYQYSGGAHGISYQNYLVLDVDKGKKVNLGDLFKENTDYITLINTEIKRQMKEREAQGDYFFSGAEGFTSISEKQIFYLNPRGEIVIVFNIYEIAPYAAGIIEFTIPKTVVMPYLK